MTQERIGVDPALPGSDHTVSAYVLKDGVCSGHVIDTSLWGDDQKLTANLGAAAAAAVRFAEGIKGEKKVPTGVRLGPAGWHGYSGKLAPCGRNEPCPCGSGKKYKKCHRGKPLPQR